MVKGNWIRRPYTVMVKGNWITLHCNGKRELDKKERDADRELFTYFHYLLIRGPSGSEVGFSPHELKVAGSKPGGGVGGIFLHETR